MILIIVLPTLGFSGSAGHSIGTQASFGPEKLKSAKPDIIFIRPEYDHRLPLSITDSCSVDLTQNFFCVVAVAVDIEESVENRLVTAGQAWQQLDNSASTFSYSFQYFLSKHRNTWFQLVCIFIIYFAKSTQPSGALRI